VPVEFVADIVEAGKIVRQSIVSVHECGISRSLHTELQLLNGMRASSPKNILELRAPGRPPGRPHRSLIGGLLEGTAFLAARVQLKLKHEFPEFTETCLEQLVPHYLARRRR